jgi:hypothetical protein
MQARNFDTAKCILPHYTGNSFHEFFEVSIINRDWDAFLYLCDNHRYKLNNFYQFIAYSGLPLF